MFKTIPWRRYRIGLVLAAAALMIASIAVLVPAGAQQTTTGTVADGGWTAHAPDSPDTSLDDIAAGPDAIDSLEGVEGADPSLDDELISLFGEGPSIMQATGGPKYVEVHYTELTYIPGNDDEVDPDRGIRVGDFTRISGTFNGQLDAEGNAQTFEDGDTFTIGLPEEVEIVPQGFDLEAAEGGDPWGRCEPNEETNAYDCHIISVPDEENHEVHGEWQGYAIAIREGGQFNIQARTGLFPTKDGEQVGSGPNLQGQPSGTIFRFNGKIDGPLVGRTEPVVLTDIFDDLLAYKPEVFSFEARQAGLGGGVLDFQESLVGNTLTLTIQPPASGSFNANPITFEYFLVTESGELDEFKTAYSNVVTVEGNSARKTVYQQMQTSGTVEGIARNSFDLNKTIEGDLPADFDAAANPFTVRVEEFAPGNFPDSPTDTYTREVIAGGDSVQGETERPAGWTIRITELLDKDSGPEGFQWGTPEFTGDVNASGVDAEGNAWATVTTVNDVNVGISLVNTMEETVPPTGISFPLPDTGDGLALWVLFGVTGAGLVGAAAYMVVRNNRSRKLSEEDDS